MSVCQSLHGSISISKCIISRPEVCGSPTPTNTNGKHCPSSALDVTIDQDQEPRRKYSKFYSNNMNMNGYHRLLFVRLLY